MTDRPVLRLFTFRPSGTTSIVDARLRDEVVPLLSACDGVTAVHVGRRAASDGGAERIVASIWSSAEALDACVPGAEPFDVERRLGDGDVEVLPVALVVDDAATADPTLLRVFRGTVRDGRLEEYLALAESGTRADVAAGHGPATLYLATHEPDRFVTFSTWTDWDRVMTATGGNLEKPISTRHLNELRGGVVAHYEVIPSGVAAAPRSGATG